MSAGTKVLKVVISGDAKGALKAFGQAEKGAGGMSAKFKSFAVAGAAGLTAVAGGIVAFGKKSANTFKTVGGEVAKFQRFTGLSAEAASRLRYQLQQTGINADKGARAFGLFNKNLVAGKIDKLGIKTRDASGQLLSMDKILGKVADKFADMPEGPEKTALAMQMFGKSGADLIPFLNKGSAGLAELSAEAKKYGLILTKDNLKAVKENIKAHREQEAAMQGFQLQIGMHVLPILTKLTTAFTQQIPKVTQWLQHNKAAGKWIAGGFALAIGIATAAMGGLALATLAATWEFILIIAAIAALVAGVIYAYKHWGWFRKAVDAVVKFSREKLIPAIREVNAWIASRLVAGLRAAKAYIVGSVIPALTRMWEWFQVHILPTIRETNAMIGRNLPVALQAAAGTIGVLVAAARVLWSFFANFVLPTFAAVGSAAITTLGVGFDVARTSVNTLVDAVRRLRDMLDSIVGKAQSAANAISHLPGAGAVGGIISKIPGFLKSGSDNFNVATGASNLRTRSASVRQGTGGAVYNITVQSVLDGRVVAESTRRHAYDKQQQTGRPWIPAMA